MTRVPAFAPFALLLAALPLSGCATESGRAEAAAPAGEFKPLTFAELLERPRERADARVPYGPHRLQFAELWLPQGRPGPHPIVILIHGGCWRADLPGLELMDYMAADLRRRGYAVWNIEYRRIGADATGPQGGGYPATFQDTGAAVDALTTVAREWNLDLSRVVVSGHSAGGHLALWTAARGRIAADSPLHVAEPLPVKGVVALAAIADLEDYRENGPDACGGPGTIDALTGAAEGRTGDVYADTSPPRMVALGAPQAVISGDVDHIVPPAFGERYAAKAAAAGDRAESIVLPRSGHFELIDARSPAWTRVLAEIEAMIGKP